MKSREEIEAELAECFEKITNDLYESRWLRRIAHTFWISIIIGTTLFVLNNSFTVPFMYNLFNIIANISLAVAVLLFLFFLFAVPVGWASGSTFPGGQLSIWRELAHKKHKQKSLRRLLENMPIPFNPNSYPDYYLQDVPQDISEKRTQADRYQRFFVITQSIIIFLSTAVASISGGWLDHYFTIPLLIPVLSSLISLITGFSLFLKFREKGANLRQTADALDLEYKAYLLSHGPYKNLDPREARIHFTEQAEILRKEQLQRQQQLEQSSQKEHTSSAVQI